MAAAYLRQMMMPAPRPGSLFYRWLEPAEEDDEDELQ